MNRMTGDPATAKTPAARNRRKIPAPPKRLLAQGAKLIPNACLSAEPYNHHVRGACTQRNPSDSPKGTLKGSQDWFVVAAQDLVQGLLLSVFCHGHPQITAH